MKVNDVRTKIVLDYGDLSDEETKAGEICPTCEGGTSQEKSFSVTRRGEFLFYHCHRASCGLRGRTQVTGSRGPVGSGSKADRNGTYVQTTPLNKATLKFLAVKFRIPRQDLELAELGWTGDELGHYTRRVAFPIFGPDSRKRGTSYRSYEAAKPKALIELTKPDEPAMCWYKFKRKSDILVIVEDQVSAIKLAPHVHAVALLGTHISDAKAAEIAAGNYSTVILSLDPDAITTAIKLQLQWRTKIKNMFIVGIACDIKNMSDEQFKEYLAAVTSTKREET